MAKLTNVRERIHQPLRDTLIRTSGYYPSELQDRTDLFTVAGKNDAETNLKNGSTLPSDQSMVVLALRVFTWFRYSVFRNRVQDEQTFQVFQLANGDYNRSAVLSPRGQAVMNGQSVGNYQDVYRLNWQSEEQLLWSFGSGQKLSLVSMPTVYLPYGGGLSGDNGGVTDLVTWNNGTVDHTGICRLARAILLPPRQNIICQANIVRLPDGGNGQVFGAYQGWRDMLSLTANLNAVDLVNKVISFTIDGIFSRDVQ